VPWKHTTTRGRRWRSTRATRECLRWRSAKAQRIGCLRRRGDRRSASPIDCSAGPPDQFLNLTATASAGPHGCNRSCSGRSCARLGRVQPQVAWERDRRRMAADLSARTSAVPKRQFLQTWRSTRHAKSNRLGLTRVAPPKHAEVRLASAVAAGRGAHRPDS
jgi:hypothetical protein